ncbi:unnamed protein product [Trifolium pratense]|uniref:Uncharacterized protein n=1 Tax=Trifolium pratense TaxID=57577 RepID=A0ACB0KJF0_TRIPR|nr:unnamed protein product [Trifolium pratense]
MATCHSVKHARRFHSFDFKSLSGGFNSSNFDLACLKSSLKLDLWMSIRHIEKAVVGECHVSKDLVEKLPHNLVIIASHTTEMDKEKGMEKSWGVNITHNSGEAY